MAAVHVPMHGRLRWLSEGGSDDIRSKDVLRFRPITACRRHADMQSKIILRAFFVDTTITDGVRLAIPSFIIKMHDSFDGARKPDSSC